MGKHYLFNKGNGPIYPDFIGRDPQSRIVADAKYKPITNINGTNYFQILAYMFRFDAKKGYLLYPETKDQEQTILSLLTGTIYENNVAPRDENICVIKHGLTIPKETEKYSDFKDEIKNKEQEFLNYLESKGINSIKEKHIEK